MTTKLHEEGSSLCPNFKFSEKTETNYNFSQSILKRLSLVMIALLLPLGVFAQFGTDPVPQIALDYVPEASGFDVLYKVNIPDNANWQNGVPYEIDHSGESIDCFDRVAYFMSYFDREAGRTRWVWISMDAFTTNLAQLGLPQKNEPGRDFAHQQPVNNMSYSYLTASGIVSASNVDTGNVEMWFHKYLEPNDQLVPNASDDTLDWGDELDETSDFCYGSFQIHDHGAEQVLLAYNGWGVPHNTADDIGIGSSPTGPNPDWTYLTNAGSRLDKMLFVLVSTSNEVPECALIASEEIHLHGDNEVIAGNVCVTDSDGEIKLHDDSHVAGAVKASELDIDNDSSAGSTMEMPADVEIPTFYSNPFCDEASIEVTVEEDEMITLDGQIYKKVEIKEGGKVTFSNPNVFICELKTEKNTTLVFEECANLFIKKALEFDEMTTFNAEGNNVTIYAMDNVKAKKGSNITAHIYANDKEIVAEGDDNKPTYMKGLFIAKKIKGNNNVTWEGNAYCSPCPVDIPPTTADCECKGGMTSVTIEYAGGAGASISSNSGTVTDNGDGTYTIYDNGLKLEKNLEIYAGGNTAEVHTSCSQDILGVTFAGSVTVIGYTDTEGNISSVDGCSQAPGPDCECEGGMTSVTFSYGGDLADLGTNSGSITDNGDGTFTVSNNGVKLEKNLEITANGTTAEIHTSCSQDILGVTFPGGITVTGYVDTEGSVTDIATCPSDPGTDCECKGGMTSVTFSYGGDLADLGTNSGAITDNGDGTFTVSDNGLKLEKNLEIYANGNTAEVHTSCSQDILGVTFAGGVTVVGYIDTEGNITSVDGCSQAPAPDCQCDGGMVSVTFSYGGALSDLASDEGTIVDNGDGTFTISNNGEKLSNPEIFIIGSSSAEFHTSCSQNLLGDSFSGGIVVVGYVDVEGSVSSIDTCPADCECDGGLVQVTFSYAGTDMPSSNSGTVTDNGNGTFTVYDNGLKLEKDLEIYVSGNTAEIHTSCSQDILGVTFAGGVKVVGHIDSEGNVCTTGDNNGNSGGRSMTGDNTSKASDDGDDSLDEVGIDDAIIGFNVKAWPIPSNNSFNIRVASDNLKDKVAIQVLDITGKLVHADSFDANNIYQFGNSLGSGIYFVKIEQGHKLEMKRVVKH